MVGIKYKETECLNGEFIDFLDFSCAYEVFTKEILSKIRKFS